VLNVLKLIVHSGYVSLKETYHVVMDVREELQEIAATRFFLLQMT
jgi:hypothetical protein